MAGARDAGGTLRRSSCGPAVKSEPQVSPEAHQTLVGASRSNISRGDLADHQASSNRVEGGEKWNRCKYQCCLCDVITLDQGEIETHIATSHNIQYTHYVRQVGKSQRFVEIMGGILGKNIQNASSVTIQAESQRTKYRTSTTCTAFFILFPLHKAMLLKLFGRLPKIGGWWRTFSTKTPSTSALVFISCIN